MRIYAPYDGDISQCPRGHPPPPSPWKSSRPSAGPFYWPPHRQSHSVDRRVAQFRSPCRSKDTTSQKNQMKEGKRKKEKSHREIRCAKWEHKQMEGTHLRRLVDRGHDGPYSQRHILMRLVAPVQKANPLKSRSSVMVQEALNQVGILKHDVIHVPISLWKKEETFRNGRKFTQLSQKTSQKKPEKENMIHFKSRWKHCRKQCRKKENEKSPIYKWQKIHSISKEK